ncbi:MAG TPA: hypothetical protein PKZ42_01830 [Syntrophales bacterium]|nr:hypothetical protein [Syntrophales bacterium]
MGRIYNSNATSQATETTTGRGRITGKQQEKEEVERILSETIVTGRVNTSTPSSIIEEKDGSKIKNVFSWLGKQLMKPAGMVAETLETGANVAGSFLLPISDKFTFKEGLASAGRELVQGMKDIKDVATGDKETSFSKKYKEDTETVRDYFGIDDNQFNKIADKIIGISSDLVIDPLWVTKPVKAVKQLGRITKLDEPVKAAAEAVKDTSAMKQVRSLFSNTTGNKEFDEVVKKFRQLKNYREGELIDEAVQLQKDISKFKKSGIKNAEELITEGLENPASLKGASTEIKETVNSLKNKYSGLREYANKIGLSIGEIQNYAPRIRTKESLLNSVKQQFGLGAREFGKGSIEKGRQAFKGMTQKQISELGGKYANYFEKNPAIQLAKKGQMYAKAITSQEFSNAVKKFAVKDGVEVSNPMLKGLKFAEEHAKVIDNYYQGIKPEELKVITKTFDTVQNWWKAQALISPSYHIRNVAGNIWNNYLANVNPLDYLKATGMQTAPKIKNFLDKKGFVKLSSKMDRYTRDVAESINEMKKLGVIDEGWYAKDIGEEVIARVKGVKNWKQGVNPLSQQNYAFRTNKAVGSAIENNARIAHYLSKTASGLSPEKAAESVKKYLFDYGDLTGFEKNILKRAMPFYTWTSKNIPLQLENIITQPAKYALPHKIIKEIESGVEQPNEKYMSPYIQENIPVRIRTDKNGNTEYFLLGMWLPYASAIDFLSQPFENIIKMVTPLFKTPTEQFFNKQTYFKNTLGEYEAIEEKAGQQGEFLGTTMRNRNIHLLRNIRILNDLNKLYDKKDPTQEQNSLGIKLMNILFGKAATYDEKKAKYFYNKDTQERLSDYKSAIKYNAKRGFIDEVKRLREEKQEFKKQRTQ